MGSRDDWFRSPGWSESDRKEFVTRLSRARSSRNQYLRIKAYSLQLAGLVQPALELLEQYFHEYPNDFDRAQALLQLAQCSISVGRFAEAEGAFREALQHESAHPGIQTLAWIEFPWYIVTHVRRELYSEAITVLDAGEARGFLRLPTQDYQVCSVRAIIAADRGNATAAREHASAAIAAADATHSGIRHHPKIGLLKMPDPSIHEQIRRLANPPMEPTART